MTDLQKAILELLSVGGIGLFLLLIGILTHVITKRKNKLCTQNTEGTVAKYRFLGGGNVAPIVKFEVDGKTYFTAKKYNGIKKVSMSGIPIPTNQYIVEDDKGYVCVKTGAFTNIRKLAENAWPLDSKMMVYYDPKNPKTNYVDRPITNNLTFISFTIAGISVISLAVLVFFLIQI